MSRVYFRILLQGGQMLRVQILDGASINITTYFKEQQTKFLGGANQFLGGGGGGGKSPPLAPP